MLESKERMVSGPRWHESIADPSFQATLVSKKVSEFLPFIVKSLKGVNRSCTVSPLRNRAANLAFLNVIPRLFTRLWLPNSMGNPWKAFLLHFTRSILLVAHHRPAPQVELHHHSRRRLTVAVSHLFCTISKSWLRWSMNCCVGFFPILDVVKHVTSRQCYRSTCNAPKYFVYCLYCSISSRCTYNRTLLYVSQVFAASVWSDNWFHAACKSRTKGLPTAAGLSLPSLQNVAWGLSVVSIFSSMFRQTVS